MTLTPEQIGQIRGRLDAATPGDWIFDGSAHGDCLSANGQTLLYYKGGLPDPSVSQYFRNSEDGHLISHAPTDIRALLEEVTALRHDVTRHMEIANEHLAEVERLRKERNEYRMILENRRLANRD